ncbi:MAG TPA: beta-ketoacyl synthase N-terminal-like domain-containing protein, partial [Candidatus Binatia bacterium]|nr:beta-ketoacyl synthase N-terminal-like domain-containing protein [Candidatus Binatia bacterium]
MVYLNALGMICSLGDTHDEIRRGLLDLAQSGVVMTEAYSPGHPLPLGRIETALPPVDELPLRDRSRNNQLALGALAQIRFAVDAAIERYGTDRIGVVIGTSTSGIAEGEFALRQYAATGALPEQFHYGQQELGSPASMLAAKLGIGGPAYVHSSACASSAKALASAARLIRMGVCDAVLAGGVDSLCAFTIAGFKALESMSETQCNPLSRNRNGINIGEGAALFLMSTQTATVGLRGWGESSDGYHMSAPDPGGVGARLAIE